MAVFKGSRVVILDEDIRECENLTGELRNWGLQSVGFSEAGSAIEYIEKNGCDIILLAVYVSGVNSLDLIHRLDKAAKIIVMTRPADRDIAIRALSLGAFDFQEEPFQEDLLKHSILRCLTFIGIERLCKRLEGDLEQCSSELLVRQRHLESLSTRLFETNRALSVFVRNVEREKEEMERTIGPRLRDLLMPIVMKLKNDLRHQKHQTLLDMLVWHLEDFAAGLAMAPNIAERLSSAEMRIASLIKNGMSTEEIAVTLNISISTVRVHRRGIRKKLKIDERLSLKQYFDTLSWPRGLDATV